MKQDDISVEYGCREPEIDPYHAGNIGMVGTTWSSKRGSEARDGNENTIASPNWPYRRR